MSEELPIIQKTYDLIKWMVPMLDRLPRTHRFTLGNRMIEELYDLLESLIMARYTDFPLTTLRTVFGASGRMRISALFHGGLGKERSRVSGLARKSVRTVALTEIDFEYKGSNIFDMRILA